MQPNHAQTLLDLAQQQPPNTPERYQLMNSGLRLASLNKAAQQNQTQSNPADGFIVHATDGQSYAFPTADAAAQFKTKYGINNQPDQEQQQGPSIGSKIGGFFSSLAQPLVSAAGTAVRAIQATPQVLDATAAALPGGNKAKMQQDLQQANQTMQSPIFGQKTLPGMNTEEQLGTAAKAASFAVPGVGDLPGLAEGALSGGLQGGGQGAVNNQSLGQVGEDALVGAGTGAALVGATQLGSAAISKAYPFLKGMVSSGTDAADAAGDTAFNNYISSFKNVSQYQNDIGDKFSQGAEDLGNNAASPVLSLSRDDVSSLVDFMQENQMAIPNDLKQLTDVANENKMFADNNIKPDANMASQTVDLSPRDVQSIIREMNTQYKDPSVQNFKEAFKQQAIDAFNAADPTQKLGDQFGGLYDAFSQQKDGLKIISDIFNTKKTPSTLTASTIDNAIKQIQTLDPRSLNYTIQAFKKVSGIDLTDPVEGIRAAQNIKDPLLRRAAFAILKKLPYVGGAGVLAHDIFGHH